MSKVIYLVAVDGSEWSERAAERAVTLAQKTDAEVHFITVIQWAKYQVMGATEMMMPPLDQKQLEEAERANILTPLEKKFKDSGVEIKTELYCGHPVEVIHEQSKKKHVNMIFVGRRGRSKIANLLLGSVANSLAHTAGVPVVLVP